MFPTATPNICVASPPSHFQDVHSPCLFSKSDLLFVGAGLSGTMVLRFMAEQVKEQYLNPRRPFKITVLDRRGLFGQGIAYSSAVTDGALLNHTFREFLPSDELARMRKFIESTHKIWLHELSVSKDPGAVEWAKCYGDSVRHGKIDDLYFPRKIYGLYFREALLSALKAVQPQKVFDLHYSQTQVEDLERIDSSYCISCAGAARTHISRKVVVCSGGLYRDSLPKLGPKYISNMYEPSFEQNINSIESAITSPTATNTLVLLGGGAAAHELIYTIGCRSDLLQHLEKIVIVCPSGEALSSIARTSSSFENDIHAELNNFFQRESPNLTTASSLFLAVGRSLDVLSESHFSASTSAPFLKPYIGRALNLLSVQERDLFVLQYAPKIERMLRRTSEPYATEVQRLQKIGKLQIVQGEAESLEFDQNLYKISVFREGKNFIVPASVVVDTRGYLRLSEATTSNDSLLQRLVKKQTLAINGSQQGIKVDSNFEACDGVHVIGPLLAGESIGGNAFWNTSSARSVYAVAKPLAQHLLNDLMANQD